MHCTLGHARLVSIKKQYEIAFRRAKAGGKFAKHIREDAGIKSTGDDTEVFTALDERLTVESLLYYT